MDTSHTILEFIKVQFIGPWHRSFDADKAIYTPIFNPTQPNKNEGMLLVVCEEAAGLITYEFFLALKHTERDLLQVWVNWAENLIHIPAICKKSADKDITKCEG